MSRRESQKIVLIGSGVWCLLIVLTPVFHVQILYSFFSAICHQNPQRSFTLINQPLPVCIRCSCIYFGFLIASIFPGRPRPRLLKLAVALTIGEVILALVVVDSVWLRAFTGLFLGAEAAPFVIVGIQEMVNVRVDHDAV